MIPTIVNCWPPIDEASKSQSALFFCRFDWRNTLRLRPLTKATIKLSLWGIDPFALLSQPLGPEDSILHIELPWLGPFPPFDVQVHGETMNVQEMYPGWSGWRVLRAVNGTAAAAYPAGTIVQKSTALKIMEQHINADGSASATIAGGVIGRTYDVVNRVLWTDGIRYERRLRLTVTP